MYAALWLIVAVLFGGTCAAVADQRHRSVAGWFVMGVLFGPFALVWVLIAQPLAAPGPVVPSLYDKLMSEPERPWRLPRE